MTEPGETETWVAVGAWAMTNDDWPEASVYGTVRLGDELRTEGVETGVDVLDGRQLRRAVVVDRDRVADRVTVEAELHQSAGHGAVGRGDQGGDGNVVAEGQARRCHPRGRPRWWCGSPGR